MGVNGREKNRTGERRLAWNKYMRDLRRKIKDKELIRDFGHAPKAAGDRGGLYRLRGKKALQAKREGLRVNNLKKFEKLELDLPWMDED